MTASDQRQLFLTLYWFELATRPIRPHQLPRLQQFHLQPAHARAVDRSGGIGEGRLGRQRAPRQHLHDRRHRLRTLKMLRSGDLDVVHRSFISNEDTQ